MNIGGISTIYIISWVIGSGLIVFSANAIYSNYVRQPHIDIYIEPQGFSAIVSVLNDGVTTAHNIRLILYSAESDIIDYSIIYSSENTNFTKQDEPKALVGQMHRMSPGSSIKLQTLFNSTNVDSPIKYYVDVVFEEGSTYGVAYLGKDPKAFRTPMIDIFYANNAARNVALVSAIFILAIIVLLIPFILNWIKKLERKTIELFYIHKLELEAKKIKTILDNDILSKDVFVTKVWDSKKDDVKRITIGNYDHYRILHEFYAELKRRDNYLYHNRPDSDAVRAFNEECRYLASLVLAIDFRKYGATERKVRVRITIILAIIVAILISIYGLIFYYLSK